MSTLQKQIEARKKQAEKRQIEQKARCVAEHLGKNHKPYEGVFYSFESGDFAITFEKDHLTNSESIAKSGTTISFKDKTVYSYSDERAPAPSGCWEEQGVTSFIPGKWEKILEELYLKALPKAEHSRSSDYRNRKRRNHEAEEKIRAKWGL